MLNCKLCICTLYIIKEPVVILYFHLFSENWGLALQQCKSKKIALMIE